MVKGDVDMQIIMTRYHVILISHGCPFGEISRVHVDRDHGSFQITFYLSTFNYNNTCLYLAHLKHATTARPLDLLVLFQTPLDFPYVLIHHPRQDRYDRYQWTDHPVFRDQYDYLWRTK